MPLDKFPESGSFIERSKSEAPEQSEILPDRLTDAEIEQADREGEELLETVSGLFPMEEIDRRITDIASLALRGELKDDGTIRFVGEFFKHETQFCAVGVGASGQIYVAYQSDYRVGNANKCAEMTLLDDIKDNGDTMVRMTVFRGDEVGPGKDGRKQNSTDHPIFTHMVAPCAFCRQGICSHNRDCQVLVPKDTKDVKDSWQETMKVPAFLIFPDEVTLNPQNNHSQRAEMPFAAQLEHAAELQRELFGKQSKRYRLTPKDVEFLSDAFRDANAQPADSRSFMLIRGLSAGGKPVEASGYLPNVDTEFSDRMYYVINRVEDAFVTKCLRLPHVGPLTKRRPGRPKALYSFVEFIKEHGLTEAKITLPDAGTRQRLREADYYAYNFVSLKGKIVKVPVVSLCPKRFQRPNKLDRK